MSQDPTPGSPGDTAPDAWAALRLPVVRAFALGRLSAVVGFQALSLAVGWQLYERTGSAWSLGLVGAFELAPVLLLMLPAGHVADRFPRRNVAMFAHSLLALAALGLALVSARQAPVSFIYVLLVLVGAARAFASPSVATLLPQLLRPEQFANVNAWLDQLRARLDLRPGPRRLADRTSGAQPEPSSPPPSDSFSSC